MANRETSPPADRNTEVLHGEIQSLIPEILHDFRAGIASDTLFAHEEDRQWVTKDVYKSTETYALLKLVEISIETDLPEGELLDSIHRAFKDSLSRLRETSMGYTADEKEAEYIFWTKGLSDALSFLKTREWVSSADSIHSKEDAYENIVSCLTHEGRTQEAEELIPFTDTSKGYVVDPVHALSAYQWLKENNPTTWPEFRKQFVDRIEQVESLGRFVVRKFIHREIQTGSIDDAQAINIAQEYGDPKLILETHTDSALRSLQRGDQIGKEEYRLFQDWVSSYIKETFREDSLFYKNDINVSEQTLQLCKIALKFHPADAEFAQRLLLEAKERAKLDLVKAARESKLVGHNRPASLTSLLRVYETAIAIDNQVVAEKLESLMGEHGLYDRHDLYAEPMALAWLPHDMQKSDSWFQRSWADERIPRHYLLNRAAKTHDFREVVQLAEESGRIVDYWFWRGILLSAIQKRDSTWKYAYEKLSVVEKIFAIRDVLMREKREKLGVPRDSDLSYYLFGPETW